MKKILTMIFAFFLTVGNAFAGELFDVPADYWAVKEIVYCIKEAIIDPIDANTFAPEGLVTRAEFNSMLLRALGHKQASVEPTNKFTDVSTNYWAYNDIILSERLGLLYGYPDESFKPDENITKAETASIISHITKGYAQDASVLDQFMDKDDIPGWAINQYAKSIELGIYVNYPDLAYLLPNKNLNRAEAAVLLYRLRMAMGAVQEQYVAKEVFTGTEHLNIYPAAPNHKVSITNYRKIIESGNVLKVYFAERYNSKRSNVGDPIVFTFNEDVITEEGSLLIPSGSTARATVATLDKQKPLNKNAKVTLHFDEIKFPSGKTLQISGRVVDNNGILTASKLATFGKIAGYTLGGTAIGAGAGVGIAAIPHPKKFGTGVAVGLPVGAGVGLVTGLLTPGLPYKANEKVSLFVVLDEDVVVSETRQE